MTGVTNREDGPEPTFSPPRSLVLAGAIGMALSAALWLSFAVPYSAVIANRDPGAALRIWSSARAHSRLAERLLLANQTPSVADRAKIAALAAESLDRDPLDVVAARSIAGVEALGGHDAAAQRAIHYAARLSRRDLPTQIWLIETAVARGDIAGALSHYDLALSTTRNGDDILMPILVQATATPEVATQVERMIARRPLWTKPFLSRLIDGASDLPALAAIVGAARLDPNDELDQSLLARTLMKLSGAGEYGLSYRLFRQVATSPDRGAPLRDGGFDRAAQLPPFDWWLAADADLSAVRENVGAPGDPVLSINAQSGHSGMAATQVIMLSAGPFAVSATAGAADGGGILPSLVVRCEPTGPVLATLRFATPGRQSGRFTVPPQCAVQRMQVMIDPGIEGGSVSAWVDGIMLRPAAASQPSVVR